ncbi:MULTISPECIES: LuxR C-terminal-related transcriptional regulator [unclassified Adlercreutzia]|uniref:helix-turn-helix transcriptional regulator n=1 Tax=unclassified Adlercreutzia TaxID=2636013 RepID=UPI001F155DCF|nr:MULTISPECIES: LuxR C-terminal-related transcriptional regulator [unclassified Adlercreutzia]
MPKEQPGGAPARKPSAPTQGAEPQADEKPRQPDAPSLRDMARPLACLWPLVLGLTFGRAGLIVACYGSYLQTDEGVFTDGAMIVALLAMLVLFAILTARKATLAKRAVNHVMRACIALEALTIAGLGLADLLGAEDFALRFTLSVACTFFSSFAIFYWLRRARGTSTTAAAVLVFSALIASEVELYLVTFVPIWLGNFIAAALACLQYPCMVWARKQVQPRDIDAPTHSTDYFGFTKGLIQSKRFLIATAFGIGFLSVVIGLLRGYPDGMPIPFTLPSRAAYGLLTVGISTAIIVLVLKGCHRVMTVGIFTLMQALACLALLAYAAFPDALEVGAVFTTTLNALMVAFSWYIIIAFMSCGWRDPYYYAMAGWFVWIGARAASRTALLLTCQISASDIFVNALMGTLVVLSTQVVLLQFLGIVRATSAQEPAAAPSEQAPVASPTIVRIMGLDEGETLASVRQASMRHSAELMGAQFLLSEREVDVLALYALGFTQKRVAEELCISPGTAHAHIKRIYAKCDMHSRQDLLDYLEKYAS